LELAKRERERGNLYIAMASLDTSDRHFCAILSVGSMGRAKVCWSEKEVSNGICVEFNFFLFYPLLFTAYQTPATLIPVDTLFCRAIFLTLHNRSL